MSWRSSGFSNTSVSRENASRNRRPMHLKISCYILGLSLILLAGCTSGSPTVEHRFCPVTVLYNADGTENATHLAVEKVCLHALQKRLDAAYGE